MYYSTYIILVRGLKQLNSCHLANERPTGRIFRRRQGFLCCYAIYTHLTILFPSQWNNAKMAKSASEDGGFRTEVAFHDPEPKLYFHNHKDASSAIQTRESYGGSDEAKASTNQSETRRVTLEVSDGDDQHEERDELAAYPAGWKLAAIMVGLCLACILVALVCLHSSAKALGFYRG
jgi:hypothetical protein